jgi:Flavin containing amine oxidoreductase
MKFDRRQLMSWIPPGLAALLLGERAHGSEAHGSETSGARATGPSTRPAGTPARPAPSASYDVAIVGGGVAGCYVAYRLLYGDIDPSSPLGQLKAANGGSLNVALFEYSGRVGGRLLSAELPQQANPSQFIGEDDPTSPRSYAEFGGFRFQEQMHIVRDLAKLLSLEHEPFPVDEPPDNFIYLRQQRFRRGQLSPLSVKIPYNLRPSELELLQAGGAFDTYAANQAFAGVLPDTPDYESIPGLSAYPPPNGYIYLRYLYHKAFQAGQKDPSNPQPWEEVKRRREEYEHARQVAEVDGRRLDDWSWWSLLTRFLSSEAIAYYEDSGGYNSLWSPGSVPAELREDFYFADPSDIYPEIYDSEKGPTPEQACTLTAWKHVKTGYSDIPNQLYTRFTTTNPPASWNQQNGGVAGQGFLQHQLVDFHKTGSGGYDLRFFQRESSTFSAAEAARQCAADSQACVTVNTKNLILAMPKRALEMVGQGNFFFTEPTVQQLLDTILNDPAIRIFMAYERPWWTEAVPDPTYAPPTCGRSTTDLNVRQFYYWHTASKDAENQESFVLASYSNAEAEQYWRGLQDGPGPYDTFKGAAPPDGARYDHPQGRGARAGSDDMARLAHEQLVEVVGPTTKPPPKPYYCHFQNWTKDPWGAGWHAWTAGNNDVELVPRILQPLPDEQVYICGECYSNVQGWVQGALNTSEVLLQKRLGLAYPSWLSVGGTWLGPGSEGIPTVPSGSSSVEAKGQKGPKRGPKKS